MAVCEKWQPIGDQFPVACAVCVHGVDTAMTVVCRDCRMEKKSGFQFDPHSYIKLCQEHNKEKIWYDGEKCWLIGGARGSGKIFHLEQMLARVTEDRNYWRRLAESAIQHIKVMAEREIK